MGAADIINPNSGISNEGESAYVGPNPELMTHLYGAAALLQSVGSAFYYLMNVYGKEIVLSEYQTYFASFIVMQVAWTPVALSWLVHLLARSSASLYSTYYLTTVLSVDGPILGYFLIDFLYIRSYLAGYTFGPKPRPKLQLAVNFGQIILI